MAWAGTRGKWGGKLPWAGYVWNFSVSTWPWIYGIRWDSVADTIEAGIINSDGNFEAYDYSISTDEAPIQTQMGRGLLTNSGSFSKLKSDDSNKFPDGTSATLDGTSGQVVTRIPKFYQNIQRIGDYVYMMVSEEAFSFNSVDAWISKGFYKGGSTPKDYRYCGAFEAVAASDSTSAIAKSVVKDTSGYSMSYPNPFTSRERGQFRTQCNDGIFHQFDWGLYEILAVLFLTEFKTWNSQDALPGYTERGSWDYGYTFQVGQTVSLGDASGSIYDEGLELYIANSFRGVENLFGNVRQWVDGINIDNNSGDVHVYVAYDPSVFDDTTTDYIDTGHAPGFGDTSDYIKDILGQGEYVPLFPDELNNGADSSSYITDYMWNSAGAWRVLSVGGALSEGGQAGLAYLNASTASSGSYADFGARSCA